MDFLCHTFLCGAINAVKIPYLQRGTENESPPMDVLALPDLFLRQLMKKMDIKDRMNVRLTCRSFENLVVDTHAGYFDNGLIFSYPESRNKMASGERKKFQNFSSIHIGNQAFKPIPSTEKELAQFINFSNRIFNRISFREFVFQFSDASPSIDFIRSFVQKFHIEMVVFNVRSELDLENSLQLIADFPRSKYTMILRFLPKEEKIHVLPRMESMQISIDTTHTTKISVKILFHLIATHKNVCIEPVPLVMTEEEWMKIIQAISTDTSTRKLKFVLTCSTITKCLNDYGINKASEAGDLCGEFEIIRIVHESRHSCACLQLRYDNCFIRIQGRIWTSGQWPTAVTISNFFDH